VGDPQVRTEVPVPVSVTVKVTLDRSTPRTDP
jgi:hypothetical protein